MKYRSGDNMGQTQENNGDRPRFMGFMEGWKNRGPTTDDDCDDCENLAGIVHDVAGESLIYRSPGASDKAIIPIWNTTVCAVSHIRPGKHSFIPEAHPA
jgi:hypothetical protein